MSKPTIKDLQAELYSLKARHAVTQGSNDRLLKEIKRLKGSPKVQEQLNMANGTVAELMKEVEQRKNDYAYLEEKYLSLSEAHTNLNAENHALKAEIERTNRHINLAENQLHAEEQQPTVINHYHNCTINK